MDIESAAQVVGMLKIAIDSLRQVSKKLPESPEKNEIETSLMQAERQLKLAEVETASNLKYELCRRHFPPEIMLSEDDRQWTCPVCDNQKNTGPTFGFLR